MRPSLIPFVLGGTVAVLGAPQPLSRRAGPQCFIIGDDPLPADVSSVASSIASAITCSPTTVTIDGVPDVTSGAMTFSHHNFADSNKTPLHYALSHFATKDPLESSDLGRFQDLLNVYQATEIGLRSVGGNLAIKVPKFFLQFQVSRIQTAQGKPPADPGLQVDHLLQKILQSAAPREKKACLDDVTALSKQLD